MAVEDEPVWKAWHEAFEKRNAAEKGYREAQIKSDPAEELARLDYVNAQKAYDDVTAGIG